MAILTNNTPSIIGIDVSKDKLDVCIFPSMEHKCLLNNKKEITSFLKKMKKNINIDKVVAEYTGGYEKRLRKQCNQLDIPIHIADPTQVHHFGKLKGYFAKTDPLDAKMIAEYAHINVSEPTPALSEADEELKELSTRREQLINTLTAEKCRLKDELSKPAKRSLKRMIKLLEAEIKLLDKEIESRIMNDKEKSAIAKRVQTFPGIGKVIAYGLVCSLPELGKLSRQAIACLVGVAPRNRDSGSKSGKRMISGGRFHVRKLLYMSSLSSTRFNPMMKATYVRLKEEQKKPSKVALTAVMRKTIITLNAMIRAEKDWDENFANIVSM
jgi:transposase